MSTSNPITDDWPPGLTRPPTADELPYDDGEPMESDKHRRQMTLLLETLDLAWSGRDDYFAGGNMFVYYSLLQTKKNDFRGPDVFVVLDTKRHPPRKSWVIWQEERAPTAIIELLSESTREADLGPKKRVYERAMRVPFYAVEDPYTGELHAWQLSPDGGYEILRPNHAGRIEAHALGLELGIWEGAIRDFEGPWLRWYTSDGEVLPTDTELTMRVARERDQAARERDQAARERDQALAQAAELEARLAALEEAQSKG